jgi:putative hydrolase of the HAD superfamily
MTRRVPGQVRGLLLDLDGVIRRWPGHGAARGELVAGLPPGAIGEIAYHSGEFDLAHHGILSHAEWVDSVRRSLSDRYGPRAVAAVVPWAADRGELDPAMVELLVAARRTGLAVGLLTNNTDLVRADLAGHGIAGLFDAVACSAELGLIKPSPLIYRLAADALGLAPEEIFFTDDRAENIAGARHVGMRAELFTGAADYAASLAAQGVLLLCAAAPRALPAGEPAATVLDCALAGLGASRTPGPPTAEHADRRPDCLVRYLATAAPAAVLAQTLAAHPGVTHATATASATVAGVLATGEVFEVRPVCDAADLPVRAQDPAAWMDPSSLPADPDAEYLPPWTAPALTRATADAHRDLDHAGWSLSQAATAHGHDDRLGAALAVDQARAALARIAVGLARHDTSAGAAVPAGRYLDRAFTEALTRSFAADLTTPAGLAAAVTELVRVLRWCRYHAECLLRVEARWPWQHLAGLLMPLLGQRPELSPATAHEAALYDEHLAACYDTSRPVPAAMSAALRQWADRELRMAEVVELGAGTGRITTYLAAAARAYHAVELSPAMHQRLTGRLTGQPDLPVHAHLADAMRLPLPDASVDAVVEHEALLFTPHPLRAVAEALRILRPAGRLVRLLTHADGPDPDPVARVHHAFRSATRRRGALALIRGKGTDHLVTDHLDGLGMSTTEDTLARWTEHLTIDQVLAPLDAGALPFAHDLPAAARQAGLREARAVAEHLASPVGLLRVTRRVYTLTTVRRTEP